VSGYIGEVEVTQQFHNPYSNKIEAVYLFPLPHNAAVNDFIMTIGERRIRGIIRERQEAEEIYQEAKRQGYVGSLLTEERPNIFTQSVANIENAKDMLRRSSRRSDPTFSRSRLRTSNPDKRLM
jgi:Ca-activated chloride channel family protein